MGTKKRKFQEKCGRGKVFQQRNDLKNAEFCKLIYQREAVKDAESWNRNLVLN